MCGLSGIVFSNFSEFKNKINSKNFFLNAANKIAHRGSEPLKHLFFDNVYVAHSRLAFQDLSPQSSQPLWSSDKKWVIIYNGEIYNYLSLRDKIQKEFSYPFFSQGDSEVILAGFLCYQEKILELLEGEYSFVIFRNDGSEVFAGRDPFGVKPLFIWSEQLKTDPFSIAKKNYYFESDALAFSSEIKGLSAIKKWNKEGFLRQAVGLYEPIRTPFQHIIQVPPGSFLWGKKNSQDKKFKVNLYLNPLPVRHFYQSINHQNLDNQNVHSDFYEVMMESIKERLVSDVELGLYLSGGIDSKFIAAQLSILNSKQKNKHSIKSFTVGFDVEEGFDESHDATAFAKTLGFKPYVCRVNYQDLNYAYPIAVYHSENIQPYTNGSAKWWLSRFAKEHVQGVLTGDGADELLCGYPSFRYAAWWKFIFATRKGENVFDKLKKYPLGTNWRDRIYDIRFAQHGKNPWLIGSSHSGSGLDFVESLNVWGIAHPLFGQIKTIAKALLGYEAHEWLLKQKESVYSWFTHGFNENENFFTNPKNALMLWQNYFCKTHLPVQVLNWVGDRMEMANTLEGRPPFLSKKIKNFIYNLKDNYFVRGFEEKSVLKRCYKKFFPHLVPLLPKEKKQFNAPFLFLQNDGLLLGEAVKILNSESLICNQELINTLKNPVKDVFEQSHLNSAVQTLMSFYYVNDFIVKESSPHRDYVYEAQKTIKAE